MLFWTSDLYQLLKPDLAFTAADTNEGRLNTLSRWILLLGTIAFLLSGRKIWALYVFFALFLVSLVYRSATTPSTSNIVYPTLLNPLMNFLLPDKTAAAYWNTDPESLRVKQMRDDAIAFDQFREAGDFSNNREFITMPSRDPTAFRDYFTKDFIVSDEDFGKNLNYTYQTIM